jgi:hypothetical protein
LEDDADSSAYSDSEGEAWPAAAAAEEEEEEEEEEASVEHVDMTAKLLADKERRAQVLSLLSQRLGLPQSRRELEQVLLVSPDTQASVSRDAQAAAGGGRDRHGRAGRAGSGGARGPPVSTGGVVVAERKRERERKTGGAGSAARAERSGSSIAASNTLRTANNKRGLRGPLIITATNKRVEVLVEARVREPREGPHISKRSLPASSSRTKSSASGNASTSGSLSRTRSLYTAEQRDGARRRPSSLSSGTHFTRFTGTKVQALVAPAASSTKLREVRLVAEVRGRWYSLYLLYWYKSTSARSSAANNAKTLSYLRPFSIYSIPRAKRPH